MQKGDRGGCRKNREGAEIWPPHRSTRDFCLPVHQLKPVRQMVCLEPYAESRTRRKRRPCGDRPGAAQPMHNS